MERDAGAMITVFSEQELAGGQELHLGDAAAQHVRVRRGKAGDAIRLVNGRGALGTGSLRSVAKQGVRAVIDEVVLQPRPSDLVALVPVADRDRMLWAAEKCVELQVTRWQPIVFERSKSVAPRGEGEKFAAKVRSRMESALEQSGGAWIPEVNAELDAADAWRKVAATTRLILDRDGGPAIHAIAPGPAAFAVGPEGGFERNEIEDALRHGWSRVSLGLSTLRFETAIVAAAAVIRATQL